MIEYVKGNFFDFDADIRVNTVNCVGVMGAGAALQFKQKFPKMYEEYVKECNAERVQIGEPHVWKETDMFNTKPLTIINFPTKKHWKNPSEYDFVEKGLKWLKSYLIDKTNKTITLPALGCGHGGLDWNIVKKQIEQYLGELDAHILVFEPASSMTNDITPADAELLKAENVKVLYPNDNAYPSAIKGKAAHDIYIKGDINIFSNKLLSVVMDSKADDKEKLALSNCIQFFPTSNIVYVLGFNSSYEIDVVKVFLEKRVKVLLIIPYGILELKIRKDLKAIWDETLITIISLSHPRQSWKIHESIKTLKFRFAISDAILFSLLNTNKLKSFEVDLKNTNTPLFYINYWGTESNFYSNISARGLGRSKNTAQPNLLPLTNILYGREN